MIKSAVLSIIGAYQKFISPLFSTSCRFFPSCSEYSCLAIKKQGMIKGLAMSCRRILKCNPYHKGGVDFPN